MNEQDIIFTINLKNDHNLAFVYLICYEINFQKCLLASQLDVRMSRRVYTTWIYLIYMLRIKAQLCYMSHYRENESLNSKQ